MMKIKNIILLIMVAFMLYCTPKVTEEDKYKYDYTAETTLNTDTTMRNNEKFNWELYNSKPEGDVTFRKDTNNIYIYMVGDSDMLSETISYIDSYYSSLKFYYPSTNKIKEKGYFFTRGRFRSGVWQFYDESGILTHTIDYDEPFKFGIDKVLKFIEKQDWVLEKGYKPMEVSMEVTRYLFEGYPYWKIEIDRPNVTEVILDGKNGDVVSRRDYIREH